MVRPSTKAIMKLTLTHRNHVPSISIVGMIEKELKAMLPDLQITEARVHLERDLTATPPFSVSFHLVTPGPDVIVSTNGLTLRVAAMKAFDRIAGKIGHRRRKRDRQQDKTNMTDTPGISSDANDSH